MAHGRDRVDQLRCAWWRTTSDGIAAGQALLKRSVIAEDAALITYRLNLPGVFSGKLRPQSTEWDRALVCPELCPVRHGSRQSPRVTELSCQYADGASYRGTVSVTNTGKTCQRWDSQTPHEHTRTHGAYPSAGLEQNYCRNPDGEPRVWCYTTDPNSRWELCDVPSCGKI
ncbi:hypothetical protein Bbelb_359550 [Branchiostoma belcheri]|nr:hypothetical protein Bbelb_359550 [Branchiostoma belcheri]